MEDNRYIQKSLCLSDFNTDSLYSPGQVGPLSTSETTQSHIRTDSLTKRRSCFEKKTKSGFFTATQQYGRCGSIQLLHLEPDNGRKATTRHEGKLENEFPGLAKAFKQFDESITRFGHFATSMSEGTQPLPLLQLSNMPDQIPPLAPPIPPPPPPPPTLHLPAPSPVTHKAQAQPPHPLQQPVRHQITGTCGSIPMPLLVMPKQAYPPSAPSTTAAPDATARPTPRGSYLSSSNDARQVTFKLPQIPIRPFVPVLLPPHTLRNEQSGPTRCGALQLLQLNDPLSQMKRDGFRLLKAVEPCGGGKSGKSSEHQLLPVESDTLTVDNKDKKHYKELVPRLPTIETGQDLHVAHKQTMVAEANLENELPISSTCSLTTVSMTTENGSEALPGPHKDETGKPTYTGKRQKHKYVAWKIAHENCEKPQDPTIDVPSALDVDETTCTPKICDNHIKVSSDKDAEQRFHRIASSAGSSMEDKPLRQPQMGLSSREEKTISYPDKIPQERLELRRLEMKSSFLPSSPQHREITQDAQTQTPPHSQVSFASDFSVMDHTPALPDMHTQPSQTLVANNTSLQRSEVGVQVGPVSVEGSAYSKHQEKGKCDFDKLKIVNSMSSGHTATTHTLPVTVSCAVQVSPEHLPAVEDSKGNEIIKSKEDGMDMGVDTIPVTSVSSLDSEEEDIKVQLSESDSDGDDNDRDLLTGVNDNEFTPPPLWYNSHSPIPIPTKTDSKETDLPFPEDHHNKEAPPSSSHVVGFSATPPPPLPTMPMNLDLAYSEQKMSPVSDSQSLVPETSHQQPPRYVSTCR